MMRLNDLRRAGASALLALAMALAGAAAVWASTRLAGDVRQAHERALAARTEAQRALAGARAEEAEIAAKIDRFRHLVERGAVGTEQRLAWVELIRDARARHHLGAVDYEFSPQRPLDPLIAPADADQLEAAGSTLRIRMPLLHEGQLIALLDDLAFNASAVVRVRECSVTRAAIASDAEQLVADCLLDWITFRPRQGAGS
ncbi:MAG: hypothetical protein IV112_12960 [Methyloversatilis discipulorum]|uniref:hypothetical protein n=1 Tax=Methyloversatilis discipulorum TaxID=1119528 RepID=UPI0026F1590E|nr:hypothetical protein [Methyloversatilis discipulorum]MBT9517590.1 hypothetical protein [Methyloversatilis discipulorum]